MTTKIDTSTLTVTRFDTFEPTTGDNEGSTILRLFAKRVKVAEIDAADAREDYEEALPLFLNGKPRTAPQVLDFLSEEPSEEGDEDEDRSGSIVPEKYRIRYGVTQRCGDDVAETLSAYVTLPRARKANGKQDIDGGLDRPKLREVAAANGLADKLAGYEDRGLNGGLLRMNISNILRGMVRRGERVVIGAKVWEAKATETTPVETPKPKKGGRKAK